MTFCIGKFLMTATMTVSQACARHASDMVLAIEL